MSSDDLPGPQTSSQSRDPQRLQLLALIAVGVIAVFLIVAVLPHWVRAWYGQYVPRPRERVLIDWFFKTFRIAYLILLIILPALTVGALVRVIRARRRRQSAPRAARLATLGTTLLLLIPPMELTAAYWLARVPELPRFPTRFAPPRPGELNLIVLGESSALGQPYDPDLSVGQIVAWQLEQAIPGHRVHVDMRAEPGIDLMRALKQLQGVDRHPDVILIYSGHNEFQARYSWQRSVRYYSEEDPVPATAALESWTDRVSPVCRMIQQGIDKNLIDLPPLPRVTRELIDRPTYTAYEYAQIREEYGRRLEALVRYCEQIGTIPVVVIPAGNLGDYPPARSFLSPRTSIAERKAFAQEFTALKAREASDPNVARAGYRHLLESQPTFAEAHYHLAQLLRQAGEFAEAERHFVLALDLDGLPMRCPGDFQDEVRAVAVRVPGLILVDGPRLFRDLCADGIPDHRLFHDAQHPTLRGYIALAQEVLDQLTRRQALGWPEGMPTPTIDPVACAYHFELDAQKWARVCERAASFYSRIAYIRYDPSDHLAWSKRFLEAGARIAKGAEPATVGVPGLGPNPEGLPRIESGITATRESAPRPSGARGK